MNTTISALRSDRDLNGSSTTDSGRAIKALVLYEKFKLASDVRFTLLRASLQAGESAPRAIKLLPMDALMLPGVAEQTLHTAIDADLIVIAAQCDDVDRPVLLNWLNQWAAVRHVHDAALAFWDGQSGNPPPSKLAQELQLCAQRHGLELISKRPCHCLPAGNNIVPLVFLHSGRSDGIRLQRRPCCAS